LIKKNSLGFTLFVGCLVFASLACSLFTQTRGQTSTPSVQPPALPTETLLPTPTAVVAEIPVQTETPIPTQVVEPEPVPAGEVGVTMVNFYQNFYDSWVVAGTLMNNTDRELSNIEVEVKALDLNGNVLYTEVGYAALYNLAPGESTPFSLGIWEDLPGVTDFSASVVGYNTSDFERALVEIKGERMVQGDGYIYVTGEVVNSNNYPVQVWDVAAAVYDNDGSVVAAGADVVALSYLAPGESGPFRIAMDSPASETELNNDFTLFTNIEVAEPVTSFKLAFLEETLYTDSDGYFHLVGAMKNDSDTNLSISLVAAVYDEAGDILDADSLDLPVYSVAPGELMYYDFDSWNALNGAGDSDSPVYSYKIFTDYGWTWETDTVYATLSTLDGGFKYDPYWGVTFSGQVMNDSGASVEGGAVIIALRDKASGDLLAVGSEYLFDLIPANGKLDYEVLVDVTTDFDPDSFNYEILALGEAPK